MRPRYLLIGSLAMAASGSTLKADYASTVQSLNPVTYYRLNETAPVPLGDAATNSGTLGQAAAGLYLAGATHPVAGIPGAGTDTAANIPNTDHSWGPMRMRVSFLPTLNQAAPFTAEFWAKPDQQGTIVCPFASTDFSQATRYGWLFYQDNPAGQWFIRLYTTAGNTAINGGTVTAYGWQHVVGVYDGTNVSLYVNGVKVAGPTALSGAFTPVTNPNIPLTIGGRGDGVAGSFGYSGDMDEVAFYTNALTAEEIFAHYQAGTNPATADYGALVLEQNPPGYWRLGEPAYVAPDPSTFPLAANSGSLGASADGIDYPGITPGVPGPTGAGLETGNLAYHFNGASGYIDCGQPAELASYSGPLTVMTWIEANQWSKDWQAMVTKGDSSWRLHRNSATAGSRAVGWGTTGLSNQDQAGNRPVDDGFWHHIVAVYDGSAKSIYVDGTLDAQTSLTGTLAANLYNIYIGENAEATGRFFSGAMDEVAIFTKGLTAAQVLQVYNAAGIAPQITQEPQAPAGPLFEGYNVTMTATAIGALPMTNQWYKDNAPLAGQTNLTISISSATLADSGNYALVVANAFGSTTSAVQVLTISTGPPIFLSQSIFDATRAVGGWVSYSVVPGGSSPISYQWNKGSTPIPGATTSVLKLGNLQLADAGGYNVTLKNPYGTTNSSSGNVTVFPVTNFQFVAMYYNPLAYYRLNESGGTTAYDWAGGLNGTLSSGIAVGMPGPVPPLWTGFESTNTAFTFNGSSTSVRLPAFNLQTNQLTIVAWINPAGPQSDQTGILNTRSPSGVAGFFLNYNNNNALSYVWQNSDSWANFQSGLVPVVGQWNFVALVIDPAKGTAYLDSGSGLNSAVYNKPNQTVVWDSPYIGVDMGYNRWFNGSIDEVAVYDRALTPAEIANLDLLGSAGPVAPRIRQQPVSMTGFAGQPAAFAVGALGAVPLNFQWHHAGTNVPGATAALLELPNPWFTDAGDYDVLVSNSVGSSNSQPATLTILPQPTFANLTNDLVLHLTFDGTFADSSGRTNDATPIGAPTFVPGKLGQAMHYNTDNSGPAVVENYATLFSPADLQFGTTQNFSVSYWIRFTGTSVDLPVFCNNECGEGCNGFYFGPSYSGYVNGTWAWSFGAPGYPTLDADGAPNSINDGQWHNVVNAFDRAGLANTYLDGALVDSRSIAGFVASLDTTHFISVGQVGTADYGVVFGADVDDLAVWRRELSPSEAQSIYLVAQNYGASFDTYGPVILSIRKSGDALELVWQAGTLLQADRIDQNPGSWTPVPDAQAPYYRVTPGPGAKFYRVQL